MHLNVPFSSEQWTYNKSNFAISFTFYIVILFTIVHAPNRYAILSAKKREEDNDDEEEVV